MLTPTWIADVAAEVGDFIEVGLTLAAGDEERDELLPCLRLETGSGEVLAFNLAQAIEFSDALLFAPFATRDVGATMGEGVRLSMAVVHGSAGPVAVACLMANGRCVVLNLAQAIELRTAVDAAVERLVEVGLERLV